MIENRSIPAAVVIPVLTYPDVRAAVAWLCGTFGFRERLQIGDGHRSQLSVGESGAAVIVADVGHGRQAVTEPSGSFSVIVRVEDARQHCEQARAAGATITEAPAEMMFGEIQYSVLDPWGHEWTFSQSVADVDPASWGGILSS